MLQWRINALHFLRLIFQFEYFDNSTRKTNDCHWIDLQNEHLDLVDQQITYQIGAIDPFRQCNRCHRSIV